jgi:hypothetical protein
LRIALGVLIGFGILLVGVWFFSAMSRTRGGSTASEEPEEVADLDVYFVCGECGTEFRVERIGDLQVPRHCGEKMQVERRGPSSAGS